MPPKTVVADLASEISSEGGVERDGNEADDDVLSSPVLRTPEADSGGDRDLGTLDESPSDSTTSSVIESTVALRPYCHTMHSGFKGKGKAGSLRNGNLRSKSCGKFQGCRHAKLSPTSAAVPSFIRLTTDDIEADLKRFVLTYNQQLDGKIEPRDEAAILFDSRITDEHLITAIRTACVEICYEFDHMHHLADHGRRVPYLMIFKTPLVEEHDPRYRAPDYDSYICRLQREELLEELVNAAHELDYLRRTSENIGKASLKRKKTEARRGRNGEREGLLEKEFVDQEWIDQECF